ncbi:ORM1-like protein 2 isoform X2 [Patiria miniata]|nr:ORM1-like protein 2 isoform X2 [Patiria miniata]XP_038044763.1 ORM1-like protein 2 isoform X2 [Patiria miniata]XP_038044764.1 ORM1-like protein 2 isoform X2 [Patiria miniata]XP_038057270.1 ORM1-like protein 2 isoform X2 [Patiria miniata]XP_038057271.1 ORM1-like protein 2 isoform X2 [Patiria miniata]
MKMKISEQSSEPSAVANGVIESNITPFHSWLGSRGMWISYLIGTYALHLFFLSLPFLNVAMVWTLTTVTHSLLMYLLFHYIKGSIWSDCQQTERYLTQWEQIDNGDQFTTTRKFLTVVPIVMFFLASFYTKYQATHFLINGIFTLIIVLPKLPMFHGVRIFNINKY